MILVSAFYVISFLPFAVFNLMIGAAGVTLPDIFYYANVFISFFYICTNPFIYAAKFNPVRRVLLELIPFTRNRVEPERVEIVNVVGTPNT